MIKAVLLLAFVAFACAQNGQSFNVLPLTTGVQYTGSIAIQPSSATGYNIDLFSFFVPENTSSVNVTAVNTNNADCSYLYLFVRTDGLPCSYDDYSSSNYMCAMEYYNYYSSSYELESIPGDYSGIFEYAVNTNWYLGVGRYYSSDYDELCTYTLTATINSSCPVGTMGIPYSFSSSSYTQCAAPYTVASFGVQYNTTAAGETYQTFKIDVPVGAASVTAVFNSNTTTAYLYGRSYAAPSYSDYNCYTSSSTGPVNGYNTYTLTCYTPRSGPMYIVIDDDYNYNSTMVITARTCAAGMGGFNCTAVSVPFNTSMFPYNVVVATTGVALSSEYFSYFYIDIAPNTTSNPIAIMADADGSSYLYIRKSGYPENSGTFGYETSSEYQSTPAIYYLNNFETIVGGRYYFGLSCSTSPGCNFTVTLNGTMTSTSGMSTSTSTGNTGVSTSTSTGSGTTTLTTLGLTSGSTTVGTTGAASESSSDAKTIVPSVVFAVVAVIAALF